MLRNINLKSRREFYAPLNDTSTGYSRVVTYFILLDILSTCMGACMLVNVKLY